MAYPPEASASERAVVTVGPGFAATRFFGARGCGWTGARGRAVGFGPGSGLLVLGDGGGSLPGDLGGHKLREPRVYQIAPKITSEAPAANECRG